MSNIMCTQKGGSTPTVRLYTLSYTMLASRARVGARAEVTNNDLGKASGKKIFFHSFILYSIF